MRIITNYQTAKVVSNKKSSAKATKKPSAKKKSRGAAGGSFWETIKSPQMVKFYAVIIILFSVVCAISIFSYYFTHEIDYAFVQGNAEDASNLCKGVGAYLAYAFVEKTFGMFAIGFPIIFILYGLKLVGAKISVPLVKWTITDLLSMAWFSMFAALFIVKSDPSADAPTTFVAGAFGNLITGFLVQKTGYIISILLILILLLGILLLCYNISADKLFGIFTKLEFSRGSQNEDDDENLESKGRRRGRKGSDEEENADGKIGKSEVQDLDPLYISSHGALSKEYHKNVIEFDDDKPKQPRAAQPKSNSAVPLDIVGLDEVEALPELKLEESSETKGVEATTSQLHTSNEMAANTPNEGETTVKPLEEEPLEDYDPHKDLCFYKYPTTDLLQDYGNAAVDKNEQMRDLREKKERIEKTLKSFGIAIERITATVGPTVTLYEIVPAEGVRISKIKNLEDDIALNLAALGIRIIAPIPGRGTIGIEVPNSNPQIVPMKDILNSDKFTNSKYELPIGLGKTISNEPFVVDLAKMPHLLMAGATGQGKSVGLNAIIASLLYKKHPSELKLVLVDPKKVEFTLYGIIESHYLAMLPDADDPIITDVKKVVNTLNSLCAEMDARYDLLKMAGVRNIKEYNAKFCQRKLSPANGHRFLPYIVLIIDEFGDLIMTAGREVETPIARLAQLARAIGIHLVIATQRPSVNIITGVIKANFPARIAFRVSSLVDSRTILDSSGANQLIGKGDMLISTGSDLVRLQCAFIDTPEVEGLTRFIADQPGYPEPFLLPEYVGPDDGGNDFNDEPTSSDQIDAFFMDAATLIVETQQGSTSLLQRRMRLGYARAGRIMDQLEEFGIVGPSVGSKVREVKVRSNEELRLIFQKMGLIQ